MSDEYSDENKEIDTWQASAPEDVLNPELLIVDPHQHFWDAMNVNAGFRYFLDDYARDLYGGHNITQTVFVECDAMFLGDGPTAFRPIGETEFARGIAAMSATGRYGSARVAAGIVGFADLTLGERVRPVLEAHIEAAGEGRFKGIRHRVAWWAPDGNPERMEHPCKGLMGTRKYREGVAQLQRYGLTFDAWLLHWQLPELFDLARSFPGLPIILNHVGGPVGVDYYADKKDKVFALWKKYMTKLSEYENVYVKLGGLGMDFCGFGWIDRSKPPVSSIEMAEATAPYYLHCIETFGVDRCMFESNFPVDKYSSSYIVLWNSFKRITASFSEDERNALFHDTAARIYRLN